MRVRFLGGVMGLAALVGCTRDIRVNIEDPSAYVVSVDSKPAEYHRTRFYDIKPGRNINLLVENYARTELVELDGDRFYRLVRNDGHVLLYELEGLALPRMILRYPVVQG